MLKKRDEKPSEANSQKGGRRWRIVSLISFLLVAVPGILVAVITTIDYYSPTPRPVIIEGPGLEKKARSAPPTNGVELAKWVEQIARPVEFHKDAPSLIQNIDLSGSSVNDEDLKLLKICAQAAKPLRFTHKDN